MKKKFTFLLIALLACLGVKAQDVVEISTVDELKDFRDAVNSGTSYAGQTVKLTADLDLSSESNWKPIGNLVAYPGQSFKGTFDGNNHVISNVTSIDKTTADHAVAGLFGSAENATIKNLTVKNVNVQSIHYAGGIVAYSSVEKSKGEALNIQNCKVIGGTINSTPELKDTGYDNGDKVGGIIGLSQSGVTVDGCTVQDVTISAYRDFGGIVGASAGNVTNNTVIDVTVTQDLTNGYKNPAPDTYGDIIGRDLGATLSNNQVLKSICKIGDTKYASIADAVAAASAGDVIEIFKADTYTLPTISKNVTLEGTVDGVEVSHTSAGSVASIPNGCTFKNITFNFGNVNYHGFQHAGTINMEGCTLNGKFFSYGDMNFTDCEFNQTNADYHMWAYSGNLVYTGCTFTNSAEGKFINVFNEGGATKYTVTANNCKFVNNAASSSKAALNVKATCNNNSLQYDVYVNNCTTEGAFPEVSKSDALYVLNSVVQVDDRKAAVEDRITVTENGVLIYPSFVAQYNGTKYSTLQAALDAAEADDEPNIIIDLLDDATLDINAWSGTGNSQAIGTTNTQSITINGNSHKLTFMTKNTDWNNIATMNDSQTKLVLNNMTIDQGGVNTKGTWNSYDINFNCAVELNNVTAKRALAFKNSATLKDVTVNQAGGSSDVYGIWISPRVENQTINIDGLKLTASAENGKTGRGIKVDDEYQSNSPKVTLSVANTSFTTEKKAAILLKSAGGVDVIDGGGNNIEGVAADKVNLVWVDEGDAENFYRYSVTGATMVPESKETDYVARLSNAEGKILGYYNGTSALANAVAASDAGYTVTIFKAGEYTMPGLPKNITVEGGVDGVVFNHTSAGNIAAIPNGATFKNVSFNFGNVDYHGFQHAGTINMEGCTLNGKFFSYGDMNFTNCEFNHSGDYHMWTYAGNITYTGCTFTNETKGKFLNVYNDQGIDPAYTVKVTDCKFINKGESSKAALNVKATYTDKNKVQHEIAYDVTITNCTTEGAFPAETITQPLVVLNNLAQVDDRTATGVDYITVTHDGVLIYPLAPVAKIGETGYPTLQLAVDAAYTMTGDVTIELLKDIVAPYTLILQKEGLNLTVDGKDKKITGSILVDGVGNLYNSETLTIQNVKFEGNSSDFPSGADAFVLMPYPKDSGKPWSYTATTNNDHYNYAHNVTVTNCSFTSTSEKLDVVGVKVPKQGARNIVIDQCTGVNLHSLAQLASTEGGAVTNNTVSASESFMNVNGGSGEFTVSGNTFTTAEGADGYGVRENASSTAVINLTGNNFTATNAIVLGKGDSKTAGTINVISGTYVGDITKTDAATGKIVISGGHFSAPIYDDAYADFIADGLTGIKNLYPEDEAAPNGVAAGIVKVTETDGTVSFYNTLQAAVDAAGENAVVTPLIDLNLTTVTTTPSSKYNVSINKSITIDGKGHTITSSTGKRALVLQGEGNNITLKDLTIVNNKADACMFIVDNLTCTLDGVTLDANKFSGSYNQPLTIGSISGNGRVTLNVTNGSVIKTNDEGSAHYSIIAWHPADITVTDSELKGWATVYIKPDAAGSTVNISNSTLTSKGLSGATNNFAMFVTESGNNEITLTDCTLNSSAVSGTYESLFTLGGQDNVVKILGSTTYTTNDETYGPITYDWGSLKTNKMYFDDTTKAAFDKYFDEANGCYILDEKEQPINLYPVSYEPEVFYYWADGNGGYQGVYCKFSDPFINTSAYILGDGEFIALQKNIALNQNIPCPLTEGGITILLGDYTITKGDYSVSLLPGVTVYTDKQTDIFSAATEGYSIYELTTETGYAYTCGNYVAKVNNDLFKTFPEAATAAAGNKVITLLANIPESYELTAGTLRVEKGAYDVTITAPEGYELVYTISGVVSIYSLKAVADMAKIDEGYYYIKNNGNDKYVNVKGRRTATIDADKNAGAGTIIKVKTNQDGQVQVLRSQAVDIPYYAQRAMTYVPEFVDLLVQKFGAEGSGQVLGTQGVDAIMQKFNESFDYHLYVEKAGEGYRIYGRTPSMKPVIEFYQENKASVDAKLPQIESFVNDAIAKVVNKAGMGSSLLNSFKLETIWQQMGGTLTKPTDEATKLQFLQEVLANETNVWNFAYKTVTYYLDQVKDKIQDKIAGTELAGQLPADLNKYFDLVEKIRPGFKYYIVQKDGKFDIVSQGNTDINANAARTIWTLEPAQTMALKVPEANSRIVGATFDENGKRTGFEKGYYTTLYTDFAYQLPEGAVALKVTEIKDAMLGDEPLTYESGDATLTLGLLVTEEIGQEVPAQTPVLIMSKSAGDINITIGDSFGASADVSKNILRGADYLINEYEINTPMLESLYSFANEKVSGLDKYEHLIRKNSGTVNNKYFFSLTMQEIQDAYKAKTGYEMQTSPILTLSKQEGKKLAFNESWENIQPNSVILVSEQTKPALFTLTGDVTRDGEINVQDVTGQTNIIQFRDKQEYNYDYEAADVIYIEGTDIEVSDVTGEVNIIQKRTKHPDLP